MGFVVRITITESEAQPNGMLFGECVFHPEMSLPTLRAEIGMADCIEIRVTDREPHEIHRCFQRDVSHWKNGARGFRTLEVFAVSNEAAELCGALVREIKSQSVGREGE